jgi:hypothetical protein
MNEIKPIETFYKGYRFRSRAEARWAVFFDACNVEWEYEPEGYDLGNGLGYLPDFLLHNIGIRSSEDNGQTFDLYIEVKGSNKITSEEIEKIRKFSPFLPEEHEKYKDDYYSRLKNRKKILVVGSVPQDISEMEDLWNEDSHFYNFSYIDDDDFTALLGVKNGQLLVRGGDSNYLFDIDYEATERALKLARSVRFEHGMKPTVISLLPKYSYKGILFDEEIEARWAIFFDKLNADWIYKPNEKITYKSGKSYSPTFLLKNIGIRGSERREKFFDLYVAVNTKKRLDTDLLGNVMSFSTDFMYVYNEVNPSPKHPWRECHDIILFPTIIVNNNIPQNIQEMNNIRSKKDYCLYEKELFYYLYSFRYINNDFVTACFYYENGRLVIRDAYAERNLGALDNKPFAYSDEDNERIVNEALEKARTTKNLYDNRPYIVYDNEE